MACWLIVLAGFFDLMDGMMARLTEADSPFGVQLDSLSDMVSFGVGPVVPRLRLRPQRLRAGRADRVRAAGALRERAAGPVQHEQGDRRHRRLRRGFPFPGRPSRWLPSSWRTENSEWGGYLALDSLQVLLPLVVVLSGLMVSSIRFETLPTPTLRHARAHPKATTAYVLAGLLILGLQEIGLVIVLAVYLSYGVGRALYQLVEALAYPPPRDGAAD
jgi:Phosphatidylserine synthase